MNNWSVFHHKAEQPERVPMLSQPGQHTRLTTNALGRSIDARGGGQTFNHPWRPFLGAGRVTFNLGTVQSFAGDGPIEPVIKVGGQAIRMSGKTGTIPTPLALEAKAANRDGVSWAVLEVHPNDDGELMKDSLVEIVHTSLSTVSHQLALGRCPIAMILWSGGQPARVLPIVHFNLRYLRIVPAPGGGAPRHLFL